MLKRYAEEGQIEVPIPKYRGFHVRPATLVSKLVLHYGSHVRCALKEETYDAGSSLDLFQRQRADQRAETTLVARSFAWGLCPRTPSLPTWWASFATSS